MPRESSAAVATTGRLFEAGVLTDAALRLDDRDWRKHAALGLLGFTGEAEAGLATADHDEARFYHAAALWIGRREDEAARLLEKLPQPHARRLLALIRKRRINVLSFMPGSRPGPFILADGGRYDPKFNVRNVSFEPCDVSNSLYADVHRLYDRHSVPDLMVCQMVEWHFLPPNLRTLPCTLIGHTSDFDLQIQAAHPWLAQFDVVLTLDSTERDKLVGTIPAPIYTFPNAFAVPPGTPGRRNPRERPIDVLITGTVYGSFHPDKMRVLQRVLEMEDANTVSYNGFLSPAHYQGLLRRSKCVIAFVRHPGTMPTRALDGLGAGCVSLVQDKSILQLYIPPGNGLLPYDPEDPTHLTSQIRAVLADYDRFHWEAEQGRLGGLDRFRPATVASQYYRFCTVIAALRPPPAERPPSPSPWLLQKRPCCYKCWLPDSRELHELVREYDERVETLVEQGAPAHALHNGTAREYLAFLAQETRHVVDAKVNWNLYHKAVRHLDWAVEADPLRLVPAFNRIRALLHFGNERDAVRGLAMAKEVIARGPDGYTVDAVDDVMPYDFFSDQFDYRVYFELILAAQRAPTAEERQAVEAGMKTLIVAALHHYVGRKERCLDPLRQAVRLAPGFQPYRMELVRALLRDDRLPEDAGDRREIRALLDDIPFQLAGYRLCEKAARLLDGPDAARQVHARMRAFARNTIDIENFWMRNHLYYRSQNFALGRQPACAVRKRTTGRKPLFTLVLAWDEGTDAAAATGALTTFPDELRAITEILLCDFDDWRETSEVADTHLVFPPTGAITTRDEAFNKAMELAQGDILVFVDDYPNLPALLALFYSLVFSKGLAEANILAGLVPDASTARDGSAPARVGALAGWKVLFRRANGFEMDRDRQFYGAELTSAVRRLQAVGAGILVHDPRLGPRLQGNAALPASDGTVSKGIRELHKVLDNQRVEFAERVNGRDIVRYDDRFWVVPPGAGGFNETAAASAPYPVADTLAAARSLAADLAGG